MRKVLSSLAAAPAAALLLFCRAAPAAAAPLVRTIEPQAILAEAREVTTNRYPDADSVLLDAVVQEEYNPDGTAFARSEEWVKVLTEKGRREAQTHTFFFALPYDTVTVVRACVWKPDGRCVTADLARACRVMTETSQMSANIYDPGLKLLHLSLAGVEIGDVVHHATERRVRKARVPDVWSDYAVFESESPIRRLTYAVVAPAERPLRHLRLRDAVANTVSSGCSPAPGGGTVHRWDVRDVPQLFPEPDMPPLHTVAQRLLLSTAEDWPALSRWYWNLCRPRLAAVTPEMGAVVTGLVAGAVSREERLRRVFTWVSQNIRYMGITTETEAPGYEPHDVAMTFSNRYGVCRDKAALLVAMLRLADIEAYPVLIHVGARLDPEVPMTFFNHAIVAAACPGGGYELMDPTDERARDLLPSYLANRSYLVAHPGGETLCLSPAVPAEANLVRIRGRGTLDEAGDLDLRTEIDFEGINDNLYRGHLSRLPRDQRRRFFEGLLKARLAGAELIAFELLPDDLQDIGQPLRLRLGARVRRFPVEGDGLALLELPWLSGSLGYVNFLLGRTGLRQRRFPLVTEIPCGAEEHIEIALAAAGRPLLLPQTVSTAGVGVVFARQAVFTNGLLRATLRFLLERPEYPPADYPALKALRRDIEYAARQRVHLEAGPAAGAPDLRILRDELLIEIASSRCWTSTHRRVQQILTYAGKKRHAELMLPFNPVWQTAELLSATVSNLDGRVHSVKPEEINLMDAPWAGGAPRYPAGRIRVVSLPAVETGSVTEVVVRRVQRDAPFFSLQHPFRHFEPVETASVEIAAPRGLPLRWRDPGAPVTYSCRTNNGVLHHRWRAERLPAVKREESLPPWHAFTPVLLASAGRWDDYAAELRTALARALADDADAAALARRLTSGVDEPLAKARLIRDHVTRNVRLAGPPFHELPAALTGVDTVLADGYGHSADRAALLLAMLRAAGLRAEPLLVDSGQTDSPLAEPLFALPQLGLFDFWLVAARPRASLPVRLLRPAAAARASLVGDGLPLLLNDTDHYAEPGTTPRARHPALDLAGRRHVLRVAPRHEPRLDSEWHIVLDADGTADITVTNRYAGADCGAFRRRFAEMTPEKRSRHFQELAGAVSQSAEIVGVPLTDIEAYPGIESYRLRAGRYAVRDGDTLTVSLPGARAPLLVLAADSRENPLHVADFADSEWRCRLLLPAETREVPLLPESFDWELPAGLGRLTFAAGLRRLPDGRVLIELRREVHRGSALIAAELYPALLEMNRRLSHPANGTVVARLGAE
jgi:transglutaminase-like putative cysteine protease